MAIWRTTNAKDVKIESLYLDTIVVQKNIYTNSRLDSIWLFDYFNNQAYAIKNIGDSIFSSYSLYYDQHNQKGDSIQMVFWMPVEQGKSYNMKLFKDKRLIWEKNYTDEPIFRYYYPLSDFGDTLLHKVTISHTIEYAGKRLGPFFHEICREKDRLIEVY